MAQAKRKISVSLDAHLVDEMERGDEPVSAQINEAVRERSNRRRRERLLREQLGRIEAEDGDR